MTLKRATELAIEVRDDNGPVMHAKFTLQVPRTNALGWQSRVNRCISRRGYSERYGELPEDCEVWPEKAGLQAVSHRAGDGFPKLTGMFC